MQAAGFVLVGGLSVRMGRDKALLPAGSQALVSDVAAKVALATGNVALVGSHIRYQGLGVEQIPDLRPDLGPLAGIEAALASRRGEYNLIVACDMPGLSLGWLRRLLYEAQARSSLSVVLRDEAGTIHPLCAVYHRDCLPIVRSALDARRLKLTDLVYDLKAIFIDVVDAVWNVNTAGEWSAWRRHEEKLRNAGGSTLNGK